MRNFIACLLLLGLLAGLSACGADDSYLSVRTHVEPSIPATETPQQEEPPTAGNRSELRGAMLSFVRNWTEQGEIRISGYSGDLTADLTETVRYITQEDPIGAYAVDYADAELRGDAQTGTVEVSIVFRRSAAEIDAIVTVSGVNGAHAKSIRTAPWPCRRSRRPSTRRRARRAFWSCILPTASRATRCAACRPR